MLQLAPFADASSYNSIAARCLLEDFHRFSVEACIASNQNADAILVAQRWHRDCAALFGSRTVNQCKAAKMLVTTLIRAKRHKEAVQVCEAYYSLCESVYGAADAHFGSATSDLASLVWRQDPTRGLRLYQQALEIHRRTVGSVSRPVCAALFNMGLASARLNRLRIASQYIHQAQQLAGQLNEPATVGMCDRAALTVATVAATKIQRWYRQLTYGTAKSHTTITTDASTTLCSMLSWSDSVDELSATAVDE